MTRSFALNGRRWRVRVEKRDSASLVDRTGSKRLATTDPATMTIHLSEDLSGPMLARVLIHEMGHAVMVSYGLVSELRRMVRPECRVEAEEWVCNVIADHGMTVYDRASKVLGANALSCVPPAMARLVA